VIERRTIRVCIAKSLFTVALVAWVGVIVGGIFLGRLAFSMKWTKAVIYAITTVNTSGLVAPPSGILAAAYVLVVGREKCCSSIEYVVKWIELNCYVGLIGKYFNSCCEERRNAPYVAAVPTHAVLLALVSLEMTRPYLRYLREKRLARSGGGRQLQLSDTTTSTELSPTLTQELSHTHTLELSPTQTQLAEGVQEIEGVSNATYYCAATTPGGGYAAFLEAAVVRLNFCDAAQLLGIRRSYEEERLTLDV
jgi:hypothetical protein